jgi:hypothetical protein
MRSLWDSKWFLSLTPPLPILAVEDSMRVEQLLGSYTNSQGRSKPGLKPLRAGKYHRPIVAGVVDVVCISGDEIDEDFAWFLDYIQRIPDDAVAEKIKLLFCTMPNSIDSKDDVLVEKLLFDIL